MHCLQMITLAFRPLLSLLNVVGRKWLWKQTLGIPRRYRI